MICPLTRSRRLTLNFEFQYPIGRDHCRYVVVFFVGSSRFSRGWSSDGWPRDASWKRSGFSSRRPSRHPLHGRNDMKTSENRFSRQKHAHKQREKGLSCHHASPLYIPDAPATPAYQKRSSSTKCGTLRYGQAPSGALRYAQVPSETLYFNIGPTVHKRLKRHNSRNRHNRLKSHGHPLVFQRSSTAPTAQ